MISCKVTVLHGKGGKSEDWGAFDFLGLPSPGDRLMLEKGADETYATVLSVHHQPTPSGEDGQPSAEVVAKWTGAAAKLR